MYALHQHGVDHDDSIRLQVPHRFGNDRRQVPAAAADEDAVRFGKPCELGRQDRLHDAQIADPEPPGVGFDLLDPPWVLFDGHDPAFADEQGRFDGDRTAAGAEIPKYLAFFQPQLCQRHGAHFGLGD